MSDIRSGSVVVKGEKVNTFSRSVREGAVSVLAEAGSTGPRTYACLFCGSGDFLFSPIQDKYGRIAGMEFTLSGESGREALVSALSFLVSALLLGRD